MQRAELLEKTLMLGKTEGKRKRGRQRMRWFNSITDSMDMNLANSGRQWRHRTPESPRIGHYLVTEQQLLL